ncbi:hypothetical protein [Gordonia terrae]
MAATDRKKLMFVHVTKEGISLRDRFVTGCIYVSSTLNRVDSSKVIRTLNVGYLDEKGARINSLWLRGQARNLEWQLRVDDLIRHAERRACFDGLFIAAPVRFSELDSAASRRRVRDTTSRVLPPAHGVRVRL